VAAYRPQPVFQLRKDPHHPKGSKLRSVNCNPTAAATLVDFVTCGHRTATGAHVRELTGDFDGGTVLSDVSRAVANGFHVEFDRNTAKFASVIRALEAGRGVTLCGSSIATHGTEFQGSLTFTGNHQWALTDIRTNPDSGGREILVFDPLADHRFEKVDTAPSWIPVDIVRAFAGNLDFRSKQEIKDDKPRRPLGLGRATYAVTEVNECTADGGNAHDDAVPHVRLRPGAKPFGGATGKQLVVAVPVGRVREGPTTMAEIVGRKGDGDTFGAFQKIRGQEVAGSRLWFGGRMGGRWMHSSLFEVDEAGAVDVDEPGEDPEAIGLPAGVEIPDAEDEVLEAPEGELDEDLPDDVELPQPEAPQP
jgi:hypothetical protein